MKANLFPISLLFPLIAAPLCSDESAKPDAALEAALESISVLPSRGEEAPPLTSLPIFPPDPIAKNEEIALWGFGPKKDSAEEKPEGYTINYKTVSILEYIRFASKICKVNFIYDDAELNFTITVVSDDPITPDNVMATLLQVLRIHGLQLLEQDNNLVIHRAADVKQIATIVSDNGKKSSAPIVTRIFRVKNVKPDSMAAIIRPMISAGSILEVSPETRQLILTDVTANVDKVASLIENLDSPHSLLEIKSYEVQNNKPDYLITLATQIMTPIAQGNPFILVPQDLANVIFIVSTPDLVSKAIDVFGTIDVPPKKGIETERKLKSENIFVYKALNTSADNIIKGLENIGTGLQKSGIPESDLIATIDTAKPMRETNSIMFIGSKDSIDKVKEFLAALDVPSKESLEKPSFFVFKPQHRSVQEVEKAIREMSDNLKSSGGADENLIHAIESVKVNASTHTLVFSGEEKTFPQIKELLATIDASPGKGAKQKNTFFLYKIQQSPEEEIESSLKNFGKNLDKSNVADDGLSEAISNMKYIKETNSILFTGPDPALKRLQEIVPTFDKGIIPASSQFYIYKPVQLRGERLANLLKDVTDQLKHDQLADPALIRALDSMKWVKSTNSIIFTGDPESLKKVDALIATLDVPTAKPGSEKGFFLYHPQYSNREKTEAYLRQVADNLNKKQEEDLIDTIRSSKWIDSSQSFMFSGSENSLNRIKELLSTYDASSTVKPGSEKGFFLYHPQYSNRDKTEAYLRQVADNLNKKQEEDLIDTIRSAQWIDSSQSFMFSGSENSLNRIKELLSTYDATSTIKPGSEKDFYIFTPQYANRERTESYLKQIGDNLSKKHEDELVDTIRSGKWIDSSHSFIFHGSETSLNRLKELLSNFDNPGAAQGAKPGYFIYKVQNTTGDQIEDDLDSLAKNFKNSGVDPKLVDVIDKIRYVKETNSLLLTGDPQAIEEAKKMIADLDYQRQPLAPAKSNFYMYKPQHLQAAQILKSLQDVGNNLKKANLADPSLLSTIDSAKYVESTNSIIFTGPSDALQKIQGLIADIDIPPATHAPIQHVGKTTFLLYKLKNASGSNIVNSLQSDGLQPEKIGTRQIKISSPR